ncbi:MAG TPA: 3-deoxy-D-manno-octulosonic acid transferase [Geobacteraceae bacterium]
MGVGRRTMPAGLGLVYNVLLWLALPVIVCYHLYRSASRKRPAALAERFGFVPESSLAAIAGRRVIWVHAVSVGETMAVRPLVRALRVRFPHACIVLSNVTETGREVAAGMKEVDIRLYFPFDYPFAVRRLLGRVRPDLIVVVETELWPNFLACAATLGIATVMVNGRISDRSFGRYLKLRRFFRPLLETLTALCMQSAEDARRIVAIGAPQERVHVTRNLKFDVPVTVVSQEERARLKEGRGIPAGLAVVTAGSTHRGEEEAVLAAYRSLVGEGRALVLVLVPRHPERCAEVAELCRREGVSYTRRSELDGRSTPFAAGEVLLVDTVGELMGFYRLADLVFVGGSFVPTGGHNVLEPASLGVATLFGPHMHNFREIAALLVACGGGLRLESADELAPALRRLLDDEELRFATGRKGAALLEENRGATERHLAVIAPLLEKG